MGKSIARIYLSNFEHNIQEIKKIAPNKKICLALKANAYGHGAVKIAKKAQEIGIDFLSVATVGEGIELREAGVIAPILLLSLCHKDELSDLISYSLTPLVADSNFIDLLYAQAKKSNVSQFPIHIKVDTGMSRHGVQEEEALAFAKYIQEKELFAIEGVCTHFAVSDSLLKEDIDFTQKQIKVFNRVINVFHENGIHTGILHCAASGGVLLHPDAHFDMIRPGILAYGYYPNKDLQDYFYHKKSFSIKPVMELVSYVVALKDIKEGVSVSYGRKWTSLDTSCIATVSIGYGDGFNRALSDNHFVTIQNEQYQIIGRICMDQFVVIIDNSGKVKRWDEVVLFGPNKNCNTAMDISVKLNTIPYEILCSVATRVRRVYV